MNPQQREPREPMHPATMVIVIVVALFIYFVVLPTLLVILSGLALGFLFVMGLLIDRIANFIRDGNGIVNVLLFTSLAGGLIGGIFMIVYGLTGPRRERKAEVAKAKPPKLF